MHRGVRVFHVGRVSFVAVALILSACAEARAQVPPPGRSPPAPFTSADTDGDGRLSSAEYLGYSWEAYRQYSRRPDGKLTADDFVAMRCGTRKALVQPEPQLGWCKASADRAFRTEAHGRNLLEPGDIRAQSQRYFRLNDLNQDGFVTWAEEIETAQRLLEKGR